MILPATIHIVTLTASQWEDVYSRLTVSAGDLARAGITGPAQITLDAGRGNIAILLGGRAPIAATVVEQDGDSAILGKRAKLGQTEDTWTPATPIFLDAGYHADGEAYRRGASDYRNGWSRSAYVAGSISAEAWLAGYLHAAAADGKSAKVQHYLAAK